MTFAFGSPRPRLILLAIVSLALTCAAAVQAKPGPAETVRLGRAFNLRVGQQATLKREGLRIRFVAVPEDSRCPVNVTCVWAGNAKVQIEVNPGRRDGETLTLNTAGTASLPGETRYRRFTFRLVKLSPDPRSNRRIGPRSYILTLMVSRSGDS